MVKTATSSNCSERSVCFQRGASNIVWIESDKIVTLLKNPVEIKNIPSIHRSVGSGGGMSWTTNADSHRFADCQQTGFPVLTPVGIRVRSLVCRIQYCARATHLYRRFRGGAFVRHRGAVGWWEAHFFCLQTMVTKRESFLQQVHNNNSNQDKTYTIVTSSSCWVFWCPSHPLKLLTCGVTTGKRFYSLTVNNFYQGADCQRFSSGADCQQFSLRHWLSRRWLSTIHKEKLEYDWRNSTPTDTLCHTYE